MRRYYEEVFNRRNLAFLHEHLHPDVVGHGPGADDIVRGAGQVAAFSMYVFEAYDDYRFTLEATIAQGDRVVVRGSVTATHRATGKPVRFFGLTEYRLEAGKIREYWRAYDRLDLYDRQLGGWRP
jgi:predicted ester cyclase